MSSVAQQRKARPDAGAGAHSDTSHEAGRAQAAARPLVYTRELDHPALKATAHDPETGEIIGVRLDARGLRSERFALKWEAMRLLPESHRTRKCMRWAVPNHHIQVWHSVEHRRAFYHGLQACGMPWTCPVCAAKIAERRRIEVAAAIAAAKALGLQVWLLTLTIRHGAGDDLREITDQMHRAYSHLFRGKAGSALRDSLGMVGTIRALEVKHRIKNGFHPHFHVLVFFDPSRSDPAAWAKLPGIWIKRCTSAGLPPPTLDRGCRVDPGDHAARYVAKGVWGLESEITHGAFKSDGEGDSRTPFDLLRDYRNGDKQAGAIWVAYREAMEGRRQLYWSNGLRKLLNQVELSDDEILRSKDDEASALLATITGPQWKAIYRKRMESTVLDLAESDPAALLVFLDGLG
jgi:hypothetical protein